MDERKYGTVVMFSNIKNYGFIKPDDGSRDIFYHFSEIQMEGYKTLTPGDRVSYELGVNHKGPCATNIVVEQKFK